MHAGLSQNHGFESLYTQIFCVTTGIEHAAPHRYGPQSQRPKLGTHTPCSPHPLFGHAPLPQCHEVPVSTGDAADCGGIAESRGM